ncbi:MAG: hypothetical protein VX528_16780 [Candidatus Latescibacterota bacterium]|nr:hypothetical protein [Candidatus Latescibacterota bacterium]
MLLDDGTFGTHSIGARSPYRFNGEYDSRALFIEGFLGVTDWFDLGVQAPYFDQASRMTPVPTIRPTRDGATCGFSPRRVCCRSRCYSR